ncbi:Radical SAM domain protein [Minicystis rosea]|nr:Radical SAM domain protein [Minicystis rosea]
MSHIALIRPPAVTSRRSYSTRIVPPLGAAYIAGALLAAGHRVTVIDALGEAPRARYPGAHPALVAYGLTIAEIVERLPEDIEGVALSVMFSQQWPHVEAIVRAIRARFPNAAIIAGGEHATAAWSYSLESCPELTLCVLGEGEEAIVDIAAWLDGRRTLESITGIAYRREGRPHRAPPRARLSALGDIPRPAWHLFPLEAYFESGFGHGVNRGRALPMLATRGCPYLCTFCSSPDMWTTRYYVRPVKDIVDEIEDYYVRWGVTNIDFEDLTAFIHREWTLELCEEIQRRGLRITIQLPSGTRSEALDEETLRALAEAGVSNLTYAPESGSVRTLKRIKKKVHLDRMIASMKKALDLDIVVKVNMIIGFPFETRRDVFETIWFCTKLAWIGVEDIPLFPYSPYPGTALYDELLAEGALPEMSNDYLAGLGYMDMFHTVSMCKAIGATELNVYRIAGMSAFIAVGYARHPSRVLRTLRNVVTGRCVTSLEEKLVSWIPWRSPAALDPTPPPRPPPPPSSAEGSGSSGPREKTKRRLPLIARAI